MRSSPWPLLALVLVWSRPVLMAQPPAFETQAAEIPTERIEGPDGSWAQMRTMTVHVVDGEGQPVADAYLMPFAMRMLEDNGNSHGYWNEALLGAPPQLPTNAQGDATIRFPKQMHSYHNTYTTKEITFTVNHPLFVSSTVYQDLGPDQSMTQCEVTLVEGAELLVSATDADGKRLDQFGVMLAGPDSPWAFATDPNDDSVKLTRSIADGAWQTMLVHLADDGKHLFSDCFELMFRKGKAVNLRKMPLTAGAVVRGRLSDDVPRPVAKRGWVIANSVPIPDQDGWSKVNPSLSWHEWTEIDADGNFTFASLPRGGEVQLIAICDGWLSKTDLPDAGTHFVMGNLFDVDAAEIDVVLPMERSATVHFTVIDGSGDPVRQGTLSASPNQKYYKGGSTLLGTKFRSADFIRDQFRPISDRPSLLPRNDEYEQFSYLERPIVDGVAELRSIPIGKPNHLYLNDPEWTLQTEQEGALSFQIESADAPMEMTVTAIRRENQALDQVIRRVIQGVKTLLPD